METEYDCEKGFHNLQYEFGEIWGNPAPIAQEDGSTVYVYETVHVYCEECGISGDTCGEIVESPHGRVETWINEEILEGTWETAEELDAQIEAAEAAFRVDAGLDRVDA